MKWFLSLLLLLFLSLQAQAQVLIEYPINQNMDLFDWENFINEEHTQSLINYRNKKLSFYGSSLTTIDTLNIAKSDLVQLEQELGLYRQNIKSGLSKFKMAKAEETINRHWENIRNIEEQFQYRSGLQMSMGADFKPIRMVKQASENVKGLRKACGIFTIGIIRFFLI